MSSQYFRNSRPSRVSKVARLILLAIFILPLSLSAADAPPVPFYYAGASAAEPQISTLVVGANQSIGQAIVSQDRKYVTLDMDASLIGNASIRSFTYQRGGQGFVGSAPTAPPPATPGNLTPSIANTPSQIAGAVSVLDKPGMILIAPLER